MVAEASSPGARSAARRVLIVDDREDVTSSLVRLLGAFGHETAVAHDAASGLECATAFGPDCAIVDLGLPDEADSRSPVVCAQCFQPTSCY